MINPVRNPDTFTSAYPDSPELVHDFPRPVRKSKRIPLHARPRPIDARRRRSTRLSIIPKQHCNQLPRQRRRLVRAQRRRYRGDRRGGCCICRYPRGSILRHRPEPRIQEVDVFGGRSQRADRTMGIFQFSTGAGTVGNAEE